MTAIPSVDQRKTFVLESLERTRTYVAHEGVRQMLGTRTIAMLERRLDQVIIPDMVNLPDEPCVEVSLNQEGDSQQVFPMIAVLPGEKIVYSPCMTTQADEMIADQVARLRELDPTLDDERALNLLILLERERRKQDAVTVEFGYGYCARVLVERSIVSLVNTQARIYQQPFVALAMNDVYGTMYRHSHPVVVTHELVHLDDFSRLPVVDHRGQPPHEYSLVTELRAHQVSALGEQAVTRFGLDTRGLWYGSIYPNLPTISSRVEALRKEHTTQIDPFSPLPSLYLALESKGLQDIY